MAMQKGSPVEPGAAPAAPGQVSEASGDRGARSSRRLGGAPGPGSALGVPPAPGRWALAPAAPGTGPAGPRAPEQRRSRGAGPIAPALRGRCRAGLLAASCRRLRGPEAGPGRAPSPPARARCRHLAGLRAGGRSAPGSAGRAARSPCSRPGAVRGGLSAERCGRAAAQPGRRGPGGQAPGAREPRGLRRSPGGQRSRLRWCTAPSFPCSAELGAAGEQGERLRSALLLARNVGRKRAAAQPEQETVSRCWNLSFP